VPPLKLPPPPDIATQTYESSPPGARIDDTLRFDPFDPWVLAGVGASRRVSAPEAFGLVANLRLGLPINVYGAGRTGFGFVPTASIETIGSFPDHVSTGLALGLLEQTRDRYTPSSAIALIGEAEFPFRHAQGAKTGGKISLVFLARGPFVSLGYSFLPTSGDTIHALTLCVGVNLLPAVM
jgi:hypothetical protein